jgi:Integrase zinc binding domain
MTGGQSVMTDGHGIEGPGSAPPPATGAGSSPVTVLVQDTEEDPWTTERIAEAQSSDEAIGSVIRMLESNPERPSAERIRSEAPETKAYWSQWDQLELKDAVLYRHFVNDEGLTQHLQLVVPQKMRDKFIHRAHTGATGGHLGARKTADQVQRRGYWSGWRGDVRQFCLRCEACVTYHRGGPPRQGRL